MIGNNNNIMKNSPVMSEMIQTINFIGIKIKLISVFGFFTSSIPLFGFFYIINFS